MYKLITIFKGEKKLKKMLLTKSPRVVIILISSKMLINHSRTQNFKNILDLQSRSYFVGICIKHSALSESNIRLFNLPDLLEPKSFLSSIFFLLILFFRTYGEIFLNFEIINLKFVEYGEKVQNWTSPHEGSYNINFQCM